MVIREKQMNLAEKLIFLFDGKFRKLKKLLILSRV